MLRACPGARMVREPRPQYVRCPYCEHEVEIWTDEYRRRCESCGEWVYRTQGATCLDWCAKAEECVGAATLAEYRRARQRGVTVEE